MPFNVSKSSQNISRQSKSFRMLLEQLPKVSKTVYKVSNALKAVQNLQGSLNCPNTFQMLLK